MLHHFQRNEYTFCFPDGSRKCVACCSLRTLACTFDTNARLAQQQVAVEVRSHFRLGRLRRHHAAPPQVVVGDCQLRYCSRLAGYAQPDSVGLRGARLYRLRSQLEDLGTVPV